MHLEWVLPLMYYSENYEVGAKHLVLRRFAYASQIFYSSNFLRNGLISWGFSK